MRLFFLPLLLGLAGCATPSTVLPRPGDAEIRASVAHAQASLAHLMREIADPQGAPDYAGAAASIAAARVAVATQAVLAGVDFGSASATDRALLAVTLKLCADGVSKMEAMDHADAGAYARTTFSLSCLAPLSVAAAQ